MLAANAFVDILKIELAVKLHLCRKKIPETKSLLVFKTWGSCWLCFLLLDALGVNRTMYNCGLLRIFKCSV